MTGRGTAAVFAALALALFAPSSARACSPQIGYRVPTNFELVRNADLIVLARVSSGPGSMENFEPAVRLEVVEVLKGPPPAAALLVRGWIGTRGGPAVPRPTALDEAHPSTLHGACVRTQYAQGTLLIAMFERAPDGGYRQIDAPFARVIEDVEGPNGLWVEVVREYLEIQARHPGLEVRAAAQAGLASLAHRSDKRAGLMAEDLRHFLAFSAPDAEWRRAHAVWRFYETEAALSNLARFVGLSCRPGEAPALIITVLDTDGARNFALVLDERRFAAGPETPSETLGRPAVASRIPLSPSLVEALRNARRAGIEADGREYLTADPEAALRQLADHCAVAA